MNDPAREFVALHEKKSSIQLRGMLTMDDMTCAVEGIADGLTSHNYLEFQPNELEGWSSERGQLWLERIYNVRRTVRTDKRPPTAALKALAAYWGNFDPRTAEIRHASISLKHLDSLSAAPLVESSFSHEDDTLVQRSRTRPTPHTLFGDEELTLEVDYLTSIGDTVTHEQILSATFHKPATLARVNRLFDVVSALVFVLTESQFPKYPMTLRASIGTAYQWRAESKMRDVRPVFRWLPKPGTILNTLQESLPSWMDNLKDHRALIPISIFLSASTPSVYVESAFLSYCHSFEELSRQRLPDKPMTDDEFERRIVGPLKHTIDSLKEVGVQANLRRKLLWSIKQSNGFSLKERMRRTFISPPYWLDQAKKADKNIYERIEQRRNQLSHGNPAGAVVGSDEASKLQLESSVVYLHCLAEILYLGGLEEGIVKSLTGASETAAFVLRTCAKAASER